MPQNFSLFSLTNQIAIVTGASRGLGRAAAVALAGAGARVILVGRDKEQLEETKKLIGDNGIVRQCDVTRPEEMMGVITTTIREEKRIDILVNNAGIIRR